MRYVETSDQAQNAHLGNGNGSARSSASRARRLNRPQRDRLLGRAIAPVLHLEGLENRTLLSTLPRPIMPKMEAAATSCYA